MKLRAQADASMPASYNSNIQLLILILISNNWIYSAQAIVPVTGRIVTALGNYTDPSFVAFFLKQSFVGLQLQRSKYVTAVVAKISSGPGRMKGHRNTNNIS